MDEGGGPGTEDGGPDGGIMQSVMGSVGDMVGANVTMPQEIIDVIEDASIPLWLVSLLGSLNMFAHEFNVNMENRIVALNVEECLRTETAQLVFANSEFLILLNQAATDRAELAKLLNIPQSQMGHITNAPAGHGLLREGGSIIPFADDFGELYRLWSTMPGEI